MKNKIHSKAWECILPHQYWYNHGSDATIVYAETRPKAKYQYKLQSDIWDFDNPSDWIHVKVKRAYDHDLYMPEPLDIISMLSDHQRNIIAHANGNNTISPGGRCHYYTSIDDPGLLHLVSVGLLSGPHHYGSKNLLPNYAYFFLTEYGIKAAFSMIPSKRPYNYGIK